MTMTAASLLNNPLPPLGRLLVVDDEPALLAALVQMLTRQGYQAEGFASGVEALRALRERKFDVLLTDMMMPELDGVALLRAALEGDPDLVGILMTGQGTVQTAVAAMKVGAFDFVLKPFKLSAILPILARAMDVRRLRLENIQLRDTVAIHELTQTIAYTLDLNTILNKTADAALQQCDADEASIMLPTPDGQELVVAAVRGEQRGQLLGTRVPIGQGIAGWVARERGPLTLPGEVRDPRFAPLYPRREIKSAVSIPMLSGNQLIGVLNVNLVKGRRQFGLGQVKALSILVSTAAAALENARLHTQVLATEERFRALIENSSDGIVLINAGGQPQYASPSITRILGYTVEELPGVWPDLIHPDDRLAMRQQIGELNRNPGQLLTAQYRFRHLTGEWRWLETVVSNLLDNPNVAAIVINYRDVTERKRAEEEIKQLAKFPGENPSPIMRLALDGTILYANPGSRPLLDLWASQIGQRPPAEVCQIVAECFATLSRREIEVQADGAVYSLIYAPIAGPNYVNVYGRDITDRKQAEDALRRSEVRFRSWIENASDLITVVDPRGVIMYESPSIQRLLGYGQEELLGQNAFDFIHPDDVARVLDKFAANIHTPGATAFLEFRYRHQDGSWRVMEGTGKAYVDVRGDLAGIINLHDISDRKQAEAVLAQTNDLLSRAEEVGHTGSWEFDLTTQVEKWSDGLYRLLGLEPLTSAANFDTYLGLVHPDDRERVRQTFDRQMQDNLPVEYECRLVRPNGNQRVILAKSEFLFDARGEAARKIGIHIDITERKQRERELETLAAVSLALRAASTRAEILPILLDQVMTLVEASGGALLLADSATRELVVELAQGEMAGSAGRRLPRGAGISGQVLATRQPFTSGDAQSDPVAFELDWIRQAPAAACVPLIAQEQAMGLLWAARASPFHTEELRVLGAIADVAANALRRAALQEQTEQRLQRLGALRAIDLAISASMDLHLTLDIVLDQVTKQLQMDAGTVFLLEADNTTLEIAARQGYRTEAAPDGSLRLGQWYAGRVALERRVIGVPDFNELDAGAARIPSFEGEGFRAYYGVPLISKSQVIGVLEVMGRAPLQPDSDWLAFLEALAGQAAIAIENARLFEDVQRSNTDLSLAYDATIEGWSRALDLRDHETEGHSQRVTELTLTLARALGLSGEALVHIRRGALLHDIGKVGIPDNILLKTDQLTEAEWAVMRQHPTFAYQLLEPIAFLHPALDIPYCHHEKWDGTGYPRRLQGKDIPLAARIFAVVDVWDALRSDRPYRPAWPEEKVLAHIRAQSGHHFDPAVVRALEDWLTTERLAAQPDDGPAVARPTLLIVDDEENVTRSLARSLRADFTIFVANSGQAALEVLAVEAIAVILSDQRMPDMTGLEFLKRAGETSPRTRSLLISGYADSASLAEALHLSHVRGYIPKPWNVADLGRQLHAAADDYAAARQAPQIPDAAQQREP